MMSKYCLITNDVEHTSINGELHDEIGKKVSRDVLPRLLDLYAKYDVKATFYFVADFAEKFPETVKMILPYGHEVACHGLTHEYSKAFDVLSLDDQMNHLVLAKKVLEDISGKEVVSFRAPALRVNGDTAIALQQSGFKTDSSIAPQRMDMFMSMGSKNKLKWLNAPREVYETSSTDLSRRGKSEVMEFPVSGAGLPYIGTLMRLAPTLNKLTRYLIYSETNSDNNKVVNFLIHPSEFVEETDEQMQVTHRGTSAISHYFSDILRVKLKKRNLGESAFPLFENELKFWSEKNYKFVSVNDYYKMICK